MIVVSGQDANGGRMHPNVTLAVLSAGGMSYALLQSAVAPALPDFQKALGASETQTAWILTSYLLSASVATPIIGRLGDIHGKKRVLVAVLAMLGVGTFISAIGVLARSHPGGADHPGRRRRHLPARLLDRARRVPAREGRGRHRTAVRRSSASAAASGS